MQPMLLNLVIASCIIFGSCAQLTCGGIGIGPCKPDSRTCQQDHTCVDDGQCCRNTEVIITTPTPATTPRTPQPQAACYDKINPTTGTSDCPFRRNWCNHPTYYSLMTEQCPRTCNRCNGPVAPQPPPYQAACVDKINPATGTSDCPFRRNWCNNSAYYSLMTEQCPRTCNRCNGPSAPQPPRYQAACADKINPATGTSDCPFRRNLCNNSAYYTLMTDVSTGCLEQECVRANFEDR